MNVLVINGNPLGNFLRTENSTIWNSRSEASSEENNCLASLNSFIPQTTSVTLKWLSAEAERIMETKEYKSAGSLSTINAMCFAIIISEFLE